jgi:hypothetical protein
MTERITIQLPIHMGVFSRLLQAISAEFPGATISPPSDNTPDDQVVIHVDETDPEPDDGLLARLTVAADDLADLHHSGPLERDIRIAISRIRLAERATLHALGRRDLLRPPGLPS